MTLAGLATLLVAVCAPDDWSDFTALSKDRKEGVRCKAIDKIKKYRNGRMVLQLLPLLADPHPRVRYRAMRAIGRCKPKEKEAIDAVVSKGLKHSHPLVRQGAAEALGWIKDRSTVSALSAALRDPKEAVRGEICSALGWIRDESALPLLLRSFEDRDWRVRANALEAIRKIRAPEAASIIEKAASDKAYQVRMEAALAWPWIGVDGAVAGLPRLMRDPDWRVRCSAIQACTSLRRRECVGWLVERLAKEEGRLRWDSLAALRDLTGKDLGLEASNWRGWWEANKETLSIVPKGKKGEATPRPQVGGKTAAFFKVPILSNRVIFILDLSGSMRDAGVEQDGKKRSATKLDIAKKGMEKTIESLPAKTMFSILGLGSTRDGQYQLKAQKTWRKKLRLHRADPAGKKDAIKWVRRLEARGWTNIYDAIAYAFEDPEVDTIYLYTDGGASTGVFIATGEILTFIERTNRFRKIAINTIEVPGSKANTKDNIRLLKELAERTGGLYELYRSEK